MPTPRSGVFGFALLLLLLIGRGAGAQASVEVSDGEVYLDTATGALSGRLRQGYEDADVNKIAIIAPETAHVTLYYWVTTKDGECEGIGIDAVLASVGKAASAVVKRSAAPTGAVVDKSGVRIQKFVAKVGPLTTGRDYCFAYAIQSTKEVSSDDKAAFSGRLVGTIERLTTARALPLEATQSAIRKRLTGSSLAEDQLAACTGILSQQTGTISAKDFATLFNCELGWPLNQLIILDPNTNDWMPIRAAMERYLSEDDKFTQALAKSLRRSYALLKRREVLNEALDRKLVHEQDALPEKPLVYNPLDGIKPETFRDRISDAALKAEFTDEIVQNPAKFVAKVWASRVLVRDNTKRGALDAASEAKLKAFFFEANAAPGKPAERQIEPKYLKITIQDLRDATDAARKVLDDPQLVSKAMPAPTPALTVAASNAAAAESLADSAANYLRDVPALKELQTYPGLEKPGAEAAPDGPRIIRIALVRKQARADFKALVEDIQQTKAANDELLATDAYKRLNTRLREAVDSSGAGRFAAQPTYKERLPFWVTGDVGVVLGFFGREGQSTETGASLYFGVNFYLAELDKSEPLRITQWSCRDWGRRFALSAGITMTQPSGVEGVEGVIGTKMLMTGAGLRLTDYVRVNGGALYYLQKDTSPLSDDKTIKVAPYFSASLDVDVVGTINGWFTSAKAVAP